MYQTGYSDCLTSFCKPLSPPYRCHTDLKNVECKTCNNASNVLWALVVGSHLLPFAKFHGSEVPCALTVYMSITCSVFTLSTSNFTTNIITCVHPKWHGFLSVCKMWICKQRRLHCTWQCVMGVNSAILSGGNLCAVMWWVCMYPYFRGETVHAVYCGCGNTHSFSREHHFLRCCVLWVWLHSGFFETMIKKYRCGHTHNYIEKYRRGHTHNYIGEKYRCWAYP